MIRQALLLLYYYYSIYQYKCTITHVRVMHKNKSLIKNFVLFKIVEKPQSLISFQALI